jgi:hypothetical protein
MVAFSASYLLIFGRVGLGEGGTDGDADADGDTDPLGVTVGDAVGDADASAAVGCTLSIGSGMRSASAGDPALHRVPSGFSISATVVAATAATSTAATTGSVKRTPNRSRSRTLARRRPRYPLRASTALTAICLSAGRRGPWVTDFLAKVVGGILLRTPDPLARWRLLTNCPLSQPCRADQQWPHIS